MTGLARMVSMEQLVGAALARGIEIKQIMVWYTFQQP